MYAQLVKTPTAILLTRVMVMYVQLVKTPMAILLTRVMVMYVQLVKTPTAILLTRVMVMYVQLVKILMLILLITVIVNLGLKLASQPFPKIRHISQLKYERFRRHRVTFLFLMPYSIDRQDTCLFRYRRCNERRCHATSLRAEKIHFTNIQRR